MAGHRSASRPLTCLSTPTLGASGKTGSWRTFRPRLDVTKCTGCLLCWVYCPEGAIGRDPGDSPVINYDYCKGCGICARECPSRSIEMVREQGDGDQDDR